MNSTVHRWIVAAARLGLGFMAGAACAQAAMIPEAVEQAARQEITRDSLRAPIRLLASDLLEGRGTAARGDDLAQLYLSAELETLGYEPGGPNGQWLQPFDVVGVKSQAPKVWSFEGRKQRVDLKWYDDFIVASGVQSERAAVEGAELVFVGYGIQAPEYHWDDFKGMNLKGKVLLMMNNDPDWDDKLFAGKTRLHYGRWDYKYESAARVGAVGAIVIHTTPSAGYPWQVVQTSWSGELFGLPATGHEPQLQLHAWSTEEGARRLARAAGYDLDKLTAAAKSRGFKPVPLGLRTSLELVNKVSQAKTANVAGLLPGSDPKLKDEVVIFTAHHDHLGIGEPDARGDRIYNGAEDNAAGCAQVLAIARALAALPQRPRRSTLILFVAAEEQGLLGSAYYAAHPTFAPGKIAANINYDGGNFLGPARDVRQVGPGKSSLDSIAGAVAALQGRRLLPEEFPDRGHFYRSDQFSFAKIGVPALRFGDSVDFIGRPEGWGKKQIEAWEAKIYHQPSDELNDSWNFDGMIQDAQLGFIAGWLIGQADAMPTWKKGDEFEGVRRRALAGF